MRVFCDAGGNGLNVTGIETGESFGFSVNGKMIAGKLKSAACVPVILMALTIKSAEPAFLRAMVTGLLELPTS